MAVQFLSVKFKVKESKLEVRMMPEWGIIDFSCNENGRRASGPGAWRHSAGERGSADGLGPEADLP